MLKRTLAIPLFCGVKKWSFQGITKEFWKKKTLESKQCNKLSKLIKIKTLRNNFKENSLLSVQIMYVNAHALKTHWQRVKKVSIKVFWTPSNNLQENKKSGKDKSTELLLLRKRKKQTEKFLNYYSV